MRIAFASRSGESVDWHYGEAESFYLWELDSESARTAGKVEIPPLGEGEDKATLRANALSGCRVVCVVQIGATSQSVVASRGMHPLVTKSPMSIAEIIAKLQRALRESPPPWLVRAMGDPNEESPRG